MEEIWKDVVGYENYYQVSNCGNVRSLKWYGGRTIKNLKPYTINGCRKKITFQVNRINKSFFVDELVAMCFVDNPNGYEVIEHIDGNKNNNNAKNLKWINVTKKEQKRSICQESARVKNKYRVDGNLVYVTMTNKDDVMVCDLDVWEKQKHLGWYVTPKGYAISYLNGHHIRFHNQVLSKQNGFVIDHINQNKLDNRRSNLRYATSQANSMNAKLSINSTSGYKGVTRLKNGKWHSYIYINRKSINLGTYDNICDAIKARKRAEEQYFKPVLENETHT